MSITTQNWDGSGLGSSTFTGWTIASGLASSAGQYHSSPYSLATVTTGFGAHLDATWNTLDGNGGNVQVSTYFYLDSNHHDNAAFVFARATSGFSYLTTGTGYVLGVENNNWTSANWQIYFGKQLSGTFTSLASITNILSSTVYGGWYKLTLIANGTAISATFQRQSDGYYLNSSGVFASPVVACFSLTDSAVTGAGYSGVEAWAPTGGSGSTVYLDDYELDAAGGGSLPMPDGFNVFCSQP